MKKFLIGLGIFALIIIVLFVVVGGFTGLQVNKYSPSVETFINKFYQAYNDGDAADIYNNLSDSKLRESEKFEKFEKFIKGTREKLGAVKSREKGSWEFITGSETMFSVQYKTKRENADSVDSFSLKREKESWFLSSYHIESKGLW